MQERRFLRANAWMRLPGGQPVEVRTVDISVSGLGIVAPVNPTAGTVCVIAIAAFGAPRGSPNIEMPATVAHSIFSSREGGFKVGLQFGELSPEAVATVTKFLNL